MTAISCGVFFTKQQKNCSWYKNILQRNALRQYGVPVMG